MRTLFLVCIFLLLTGCATTQEPGVLWERSGTPYLTETTVAYTEPSGTVRDITIYNPLKFSLRVKIYCERIAEADGWYFVKAQDARHVLIKDPRADDYPEGCSITKFEPTDSLSLSSDTR